MEITRYIRLTELIFELLQLVDENRIAFSPAVKISYLTPEEQKELLNVIQAQECTPPLSQAQRMKKLSQINKLTPEVIYATMTEEKPNQRE